MKPLNASALRATRVCRERYSTPNGLYLLDHYRWVEGCRRPDGRVVAGPPSLRAVARVRVRACADFFSGFFYSENF
jgi:hypothetical protein